MKTFTQKIGSNEATLTAYLHDLSPVLHTADVRPAVLVLPGGGYNQCSDREGEPIALAYLAEGFNAFVLRYTVGPEMVLPQPLRDAEDALEYLRENAAGLHIDVGKIAVVGFSAGGHLAAWLGTGGRIRPAALVLGYAQIFPVPEALCGHQMPSILDMVDGNTPPAFLFSTADDAVVPVKNSLAFATALEEAGVPFEMHIYASGKHGLSLAKPLTADGNAQNVRIDVAGWHSQSVAWLFKLLGDFPVE